MGPEVYKGRITKAVLEDTPEYTYLMSYRSSLTHWHHVRGVLADDATENGEWEGDDEEKQSNGEDRGPVDGGRGMLHNGGGVEEHEEDE